MSDQHSDRLRQACVVLRQRPYTAMTGDPKKVALALADLLDDIAGQYDDPPCNSPDGVCNGCEYRHDFVSAGWLADAVMGGTP